MFRTQCLVSSRSVLLSLPLGAAVALALIASRPASALTWTSVACAGALECPQVDTPVGPCSCGLYKDSPGVATTVRKDAAFVFVTNHIVNVDETAAWKAPVIPPLVNEATLEVRAAVNENADLKVVLYNNIGGEAYNRCLTQGFDVVGFLDWNDAEDDDMFRVRTAAIAPNANVAGICLIITENPENVNPSSRRSSAIVDYIALISANGIKTYAEDFELAF